ncbi:unnamed protein product [Caenorhabditis auriculariae]|uniref:Nematode cuticle collagen N-terminal domain-containing protein n=1 Tax=Caenorhabditis auriculariae TaxID=2777116 RepID=A0A8S1HGV2_9PELO|nr:unnamed protein product [Caenorhabditis auriculariae]
MAGSLRHLATYQKALLAARSSPRLSTVLPANFTAIRTSTSINKDNEAFAKVHDHSTHFKIERYWAAGMLPILPASYFIHGPVMDAVLTVAITLHVHWGIQGVMADYGRPYVIGDAAAKAGKISVYILTGLLLAGLLHFNTNDVGLTRAFELKEKPIEESEPRQRGLFTVVPTTKNDEIPHCSHGPDFFACAVYRSDEAKCNFHTEVDENNKKIEKPEPEEPAPKKPRIVREIVKKDVPWDYGCIPKKLKKIPKEDTLLYCRVCNDVFANKHACICEPVKRSILRTPTRLLQPLDSQAGEAQYFFSDESLGVVLSAIDEAKVDGVLCIGAPRVIETLKIAKTEHQLFLLDYDRRHAHFFPSTQFAQYSMLVDHFFDPKSEEKLVNFFKNSGKVLIVVDPPFGAFIDPLMKSLEKIKHRFLGSRPPNSTGSFHSIIILPIYVGKHVIRNDKSFWMSDYRVTYDNHKVFSKPSKSIVRLFTDLPAKCFDLSDVEGYRFCDMCETYVTEKNQHCFKCMACTSLAGQYNHCDRCKRCVKVSYKHCRQCFEHFLSRLLLMEEKEDEIAGLRQTACFAIGLATLALSTIIIILPLLFNQAQDVQSKLEHELQFCTVQTHDLWDELAKVEEVTGQKSRLKRQYAVGYPTDNYVSGGHRSLVNNFNSGNTAEQVPSPPVSQNYETEAYISAATASVSSKN